MKKKQILEACLMSIAIASLTSCSPLKINNYIEDSPLSLVESQVNQALEKPEIKAIYEEYFPNGRLELSYREKTKRTDTKTFLRPNLKTKDEFDSLINLGFEVKY